MTRASFAALLSTLGAALVGGCAPAYRPPAPFVPALREEGDANVALHLGTGGVQLDGAYAATGGLALRAGVQVAGYSGEGAYTLGTVGAGWYSSNDTACYGLTATAGAGYSRGVWSFDLVAATPSATTTTTTTTTWRNSGALVTSALRWESSLRFGDSGVLGANIGPTWHLLAHDGPSDGTGTGSMVMVETAAVARGGPAPVMLEGSIGLALPIWSTDQEGDDGEVLEVGIPFPLVLGLGLTFDL